MTLHEHLVSRGLDPTSHHVWLDEERFIASFPLWNLSGQLCGFQQYNPNGSKLCRNEEKHRWVLKYFTFVGDEGNKSNPHKKKLAVWGLETVSPGDRVVFVTEGIFDAVKLQNMGLPALAVLANDPQTLRPWLHALGKRVVAVCDRDDAGRKLGSVADIVLVVPEPFHDLGDMSQQAVEAFVSSQLSL